MTKKWDLYKPQRDRIWTPERFDKVTELIEKGWRTVDIADYFGLTLQSFYSVCKQYGYKTSNYQRTWTHEKVTELHKHMEYGYSWQTISKLMNLDAGSLRTYVSRNSIKKHPNADKRIALMQTLRRCKADTIKTRREFTITLDDLWPFPDYCPIFGYKLIYKKSKDRGHRPKELASIDRIDANKGYVPGNVQIISWEANRLKGAMTLPQLIDLGNWAQRQMQLE